MSGERAAADSELRMRAATVAAFPLLLAAGVAVLPLVVDYGDHAAAAALARDHSARWLLGHATCAIAFGWSIVAAVTLLRDAPRARGTLPFLAAGAALHAFGLGADGIGPLACGGEAFFAGSAGHVPVVFVTGAALFGLGQIGLVLALTQGTARRRRAFLVAAAVAFPVAEAVPSGVGLYAVAAAACAVYLPLAATVGADRAAA